jgi:type II secretory pathway pseudopilin PulG
MNIRPLILSRFVPVRRGWRAGMSLIEIMVSMFLLTVIMLGLFSAFYQTQRAFRMSASQTDVLDGGRTTLSLLARELQEAAPSQQSKAVNLFATTEGGITLPLPGGVLQTNRLQRFFFLTRDNDVWNGIGYLVGGKGEGVGTLYRFSASLDAADLNLNLWSLYDVFMNALPGDTNVGRVAEGVVHLTVRAFNIDGLEYLPPWPPPGWPINGTYWPTNDLTVPQVAVWDGGLAFTNQVVPAWLDVELGTVDAQVYRQFNVISSNSPAAGVNFLRNQAGKVYLFRQRVPIRNHHES